MKQKKVYQSLFILLAFLLVLLPFLTTFNDVLTKIVLNFSFYIFLQQKVVPFEVGIVGVILKLMGIQYIQYPDGLQVDNIFLKFSWNCLGWQSLLIFLGSLVIGLKSASYTLSSKIKTISLGLLGVFWINILRISFTIILAKFSMPIFRYVFHDILAAFVTIIFLFFFWWFSFSFILETKTTD